MYSRINYDFVGYFETLDSDLKTIFEQLKLGASSFLTKINHHSTNASQRLYEHFTQKILEQVNTIYERDFEIFGYKLFNNLPTSPEEWEAGLKKTAETTGAKQAGSC